MLKNLILLFPLTLFGYLNGSGDFQIWNSNRVDYRISRRVMLTGETEFRYGRNGSKLYYKHYQGGIHWTLSPLMTSQIAYRETFIRSNKKWGKERNPLFDLTLQARSKTGWAISDRNRVQYRIRSKRLGGKKSWVYRNRLEITLPARFTRYRMAPFITDEIFWEESRGISQNRLEGGVFIPYHQRAVLRLAYIYRLLKNKNSDYVNHNVLWAQFSLHF